MRGLAAASAALLAVSVAWPVAMANAEAQGRVLWRGMEYTFTDAPVEAFYEPIQPEPEVEDVQGQNDTLETVTDPLDGESWQDEWDDPEVTEVDCYEPQACAGDLRYNGVESDGQYRYTWYSQNVLPGGGLSIPGRHVGEGGYIMDGDGNICVASSDLPYGTRVQTPYGAAVVYDSGCASGTIDVYTDW